MSPRVLGAPGVRCYLGEVGGERVTTGVGVTLGESSKPTELTVFTEGEEGTFDVLDTGKRRNAAPTC
jgi:hypothetical protein